MRLPAGCQQWVPAAPDHAKSGDQENGCGTPRLQERHQGWVETGRVAVIQQHHANPHTEPETAKEGDAQPTLGDRRRLRPAAQTFPKGQNQHGGRQHPLEAISRRRDRLHAGNPEDALR